MRWVCSACCACCGHRALKERDEVGWVLAPPGLLLRPELPHMRTVWGCCCRCSRCIVPSPSCVLPACPPACPPACLP
jgi:hypothetical protein